MEHSITLEINEDIVARAKQFAKENNTTISKLVERYLDQITRNDEEKTQEALTPLVRSLYGIAPLTEESEPGEDYFDYLLKRSNTGKLI
jgi:hypothetical protein